MAGEQVAVWVAIGISVVSLVVAGGSAWATWNQATEAAKQNAQTAQINADNVILRFADQGLALGKTPACFRYALSLTDDELRSVFREKMESITVRQDHVDDLQICLGVDVSIPILKKANLDIFRMKIQQKLNSYETAFASLRDGIGKREDVCVTVFDSFQQSASEFLKRMTNMGEKADEFKSGAYWTTALEIAQSGRCE